jgi:ankyrin repeat protein
MGLIARLFGKTIHQAAKRGDKTAVEHYLDSGISPHERDSYGDTPLHYAAYEGHLAIVELLIKRGADPHALTGVRTNTLTLGSHARS